jgi:dipeptidyl aminopeptidase/acylaminoacyl peptidase
MLKPLQTADDAPWKQRFRRTTTWTQLAKANPARGMAVSNRTGVYQLYAWEVASGELRQITERPAGKIQGVIAPDGRHIYYHDDEAGNEIGRFVRVPYTGGAPEVITPDLPPYASWSLGFSRSGNRLGFNTAGQHGFTIYVQDIDPDGTLTPPRAIYQHARLLFGPLFSYNGDSAVVMSAERSTKPQFSLLAFDVASGARINELWDGDDTSISAYTFSPLPGDPRVLAASDRSGVARPLLWNARTGERTDLDIGDLPGDWQPDDWSPDGRSIVLRHFDQAVEQLYIYDLDSATLRRLDHPSGTFNGVAFASNDELFVHLESSTQPLHLLALDPRSGATRRVVLPPGDVPPGHAWRSVRFASRDGTTIQGWLATPDGDGPFATILEMHGGPSAVQRETFAATSQAWLDHGFAYLSINYRGSTTFGKAFEEQIWGDLGNLELDDMQAAREFLIREGIAQPDAILLTGWSYGGYLTLMGLGKQPNLWAGGMAGVAIADWALQYEDSADTLKGYQVAMLGGTPDEKPEVYARASPITYAQAIAAPVLVIQGSNDTRCPARPMRVYEEKLRALGKDITVHWFEAGHGSYVVEQSIDHQERMLRFAYNVLG